MASATPVQIPEPEITLTLTNDEATWLKNNMQNPLHGQTLKAELSWEGEYRHELFEALRGALSHG